MKPIDREKQNLIFSLMWICWQSRLPLVHKLSSFLYLLNKKMQVEHLVPCLVLSKCSINVRWTTGLRKASLGPEGRAREKRGTLDRELDCGPYWGLITETLGFTEERSPVCPWGVLSAEGVIWTHFLRLCVKPDRRDKAAWHPRTRDGCSWGPFTLLDFPDLGWASELFRRPFTPPGGVVTGIAWQGGRDCCSKNLIFCICWHSWIWHLQPQGSIPRRPFVFDVNIMVMRGDIENTL